MRKSAVLLRILATAGALAGGAAAALAAGPPLTLERTIALPDVAGRIDHLAVDVGGGRLFVAELGNGSVDVVDLPSAKPVHRIAGLSEPQGIAYLAASGLIVVSDGGDGSVRFFDGGNFTPRGVIDLGADADNVRVDAATGHLLVGHGDGGLAVIDPTTRTVLADIRLPGHPESFQIDTQGRRAFVNVPAVREVVVVDLAARRPAAAWSVAGLSANFPMAFDGGRTVAVGFRRPAALALLDAATGALRQRLDTCGDADDIFFDAARDRVYVSCGAGAVDVLQRADDRFASIGHVATSTGARTSLFVPDLDRLFVAARATLPVGPAAILVYRPAP